MKFGSEETQHHIKEEWENQEPKRPSYVIKGLSSNWAYPIVNEEE